jgi:hypothetical protein
MFNLDYITLKSISGFLGISNQTIIRKEHVLFIDGMKRNSNGWRFCNIYQLMDAYNAYWSEIPSWDKVAAFLYDEGIKNPDRANEILLKLKLNNKIS